MSDEFTGGAMSRRVCFDARIIRRWESGVGRITLSLLSALPSVAPALDLVLLLDERSRPVPTPIGDGVVVKKVRMGTPSLGQHLRLPGWLRRERVDAVFHLHPYSVPIWSPVPRMVSILDLYPLIDPGSFPLGTGLHYRAVIGPVARRTAIVLTISEASKADIVRVLRVPAQRITVLPLAADGVFRPIPAGAQRERILRKLGVDEPFVLYHGNQRPHKNVAGLVHAFASARRRFGFAHRLVITGKEEPGSRERDFSVARGAISAEQIEPGVVFPGYVKDEELAVLYSAAGALFLPSLMEGFGLPVLEAFACGAPVVCANRGALPELAGGAAALVDPSDIEAMASVLGKVLVDPRSARDLASRGLVRSRDFTWVRSARVFHEALKSLLGETDRAGR